MINVVDRKAFLINTCLPRENFHVIQAPSTCTLPYKYTSFNQKYYKMAFWIINIIPKDYSGMTSRTESKSQKDSRKEKRVVESGDQGQWTKPVLLKIQMWMWRSRIWCSLNY